MRSQILCEDGHFSLCVNGYKLPLYGYMTYLPKRGCYTAFREAGVQLMFVPIYMGDRGINQNTCTRPFQNNFWKGPGQYDFTSVKQAFERAARGSDTVYIIPRIMTDPPAWWDEMHPGELCRSYQGEPCRASFASLKRREDIREALSAFHGWCVETGWSERIAGWHLAGGNTEEFIRPMPHPGFMGDYSEPAVKAWHARMGDDTEVPSPLLRKYTDENGLRDPEGDRLAIEYYRFHAEVMADAIIDLCRAGHEITGGTIPMGAFYGYLVNVTDPDLGHGAIHKVLESPYVDFLASPFSYTGLRAAGTDWPLPGPVASARLHKKPWFIESDVRTCLTKPLKDCCESAPPKVNKLYEGGVWAGPDTEKQSLEMMKKALGSILCQGTALWWFDMWGGWYDSTAFMNFHRKAKKLYENSVFHSRAQTAVILDEELIYRNTGGRAYRAHHDVLAALSRTGAPFDVYARSDLDVIPAEQYQVLIFPALLGEIPDVNVPVRMVTGRAMEGRAVPGGTLCAEKGIFAFPDIAPDHTALQDALMGAGVHLYSYTGDVCHAGGDFVCLHAVTAGVKRVYLPREGLIRDAFTDEILNVSRSFAEFTMEAGETRLLRTDSAAFTEPV